MSPSRETTRPRTPPPPLQPTSTTSAATATATASTDRADGAQRNNAPGVLPRSPQTPEKVRRIVSVPHLYSSLWYQIPNLNKEHKWWKMQGLRCSSLIQAQGRNPASCKSEAGTVLGGAGTDERDGGDAERVCGDEHDHDGEEERVVGYAVESEGCE